KVRECSTDIDAEHPGHQPPTLTTLDLARDRGGRSIDPELEYAFPHEASIYSLISLNSLMKTHSRAESSGDGAGRAPGRAPRRRLHWSGEFFHGSKNPQAPTCNTYRVTGPLGLAGSTLGADCRMARC